MILDFNFMLIPQKEKACPWQASTYLYSLMQKLTGITVPFKIPTTL
jgi:hypothetical protein